MKPPIPDAVRRFLLTYIPTVPHLEALLLVWRGDRPTWSTEEIATRLYIGDAQARGYLDELLQAGLVETDADARFRPRRDQPALASLLSDVERTYSRRVCDVAELIHANSEQRGGNDGVRVRSR